jgi:Rrf2 family protein
MRLGRESEYGLNGLVTLAQEGDGAVMTLDAIANRHGLPRSFLAKIFVKFVQHGLVKSFRGAIRGYGLARSPGEITLREILETIEGPDLFERCLFCNRRCADLDPCPLHEGWNSVKSRFIELAEGTTLLTLASANRAPAPIGRS